MAVNKVIYGGNTLVDLTGDTVTAADLADGVKATGADGNPIVGIMQKVTIEANNDALRQLLGDKESCEYCHLAEQGESLRIR